MSEFERKEGTFIGHTSCDECGSLDNVAVYKKEDESVDGFCWGCDTFVRGDKIETNSLDNKKTFSKKEPITQEQVDVILGKTTFNGNNYRGISNSVLKFTGIRTEFDNEGNVICRYYPAYEDEVLVGYKRRFHPKDFTKGPVGKAGSTCDLMGMNVHEKGGKRVLITAGEEDYAAAVMMLRKYQVDAGRQEHSPMAVVSPLTGESGSKRQIQNNYDWLNSFSMIIIGYDNDEAGRAAAQKIAKILPQDKVYIAEWPCKDVNQCLKDKKNKDFISAYFNAKKFSPSGILSSAELFSHTLARAHIPRIPLPPFMSKAEDMLCGGIPLGYIVNILAASGIGKTTIVNECLYYWIFNCPHMTGVVSLEATAGEYYNYILSRHLGRKIDLIPTQEEKIEYLTSHHVTEREKELGTNDLGEPRFYLLDDRGDVKSLKEKIEYLIVVNECKVIIVDPLQDILDELPTEEEAKFMRWMKQMVALHEVSFININHARKNGNGTKANSRGAELNEEDMAGSSTIFKSGAINIILSRDKLAECALERNSTKVVLAKARGAGNTGKAGEFYYNNKSHTLVALDEASKEILRNELNGGAIDIPPDFGGEEAVGDFGNQLPLELYSEEVGEPAPTGPVDDVDTPFDIF